MQFSVKRSLFGLLQKLVKPQGTSLVVHVKTKPRCRRCKRRLVELLLPLRAPEFPLVLAFFFRIETRFAIRFHLIEMMLVIISDDFIATRKVVIDHAVALERGFGEFGLGLFCLVRASTSSVWRSIVCLLRRAINALAMRPTRFCLCTGVCTLSIGVGAVSVLW